MVYNNKHIRFQQNTIQQLKDRKTNVKLKKKSYNKRKEEFLSIKKFKQTE